MKVNVPKGIKFTIVKLVNGKYQPQKEYGNRMLYPAFDTLRDADIFMNYTVKGYNRTIVGNVQIVDQVIN